MAIGRWIIVTGNECNDLSVSQFVVCGGMR